MFYGNVTVDLRGTAPSKLLIFMNLSPLSERILDIAVKRCDRKVMTGHSNVRCQLETRPVNDPPLEEVRAANVRAGLKKMRMTDGARQGMNDNIRDTFGFSN